MAPSSLPSLLLPLAIILLTQQTTIHAHSSYSTSTTIKCRSGWTNTLQTLTPSQLNDNYCDCPYDGLDEPNTGACSGSMDGMWAGISPKYGSDNVQEAATLPAYFECPQQPLLKLPLSRVNDGICDCCDGADELTSLSKARGTSGNDDMITSCPDICDQVLAEERALRATLQKDYTIGSKKRNESISEYQNWLTASLDKLSKLKNVELAAAEVEQMDVGRKLSDAKVGLAKEWIRGVEELVDDDGNHGKPVVMEIVSGYNDISDLATFILSLCWLSAEASSENIANDDCVALERASLDLGILWSHDEADDDSAVLPNFHVLDTEVVSAVEDFADKIMLRLEGKDTAKNSNNRAARRNKNRHEKKQEKQPEYDSSDDPYGDDWEGRGHDNGDDWGDRGHDSYDDEEDADYHDNEVGDSPPAEGEEVKSEEPQLPQNEILLKSLLDKVPIDRSLFKEQSKRLLSFSREESKDEADDEEAKESTAEDDSANDNDENDDESTPNKDSGVDPMALQMVKSTTSKHLSSISRGETSAKSAARYVASVMTENNSNSDLGDWQKLAVMTMYHSKISLEDVAELIYATSSSFRSTEEKSGGNNESSCSAPWWSTMCPPRTVQRGGGKTWPPTVIVEAAQTKCEHREKNSPGVCTVEEGDEMEFPATVPDGYYNYYAPQPRSSDDGLTSYFSGIESLHSMPTELSDLKKSKNAIDRNKKSLTKKVEDLERETGDDSSDGGGKYGVDGELYTLGDTCHTVESGKYEYEVCIFGKAAQRDIGQKSGGTQLGSWEEVDIDDDGQRTLMWGGGTKCWNGPVRSAKVIVTCGADTKLLTADEPDTCQYVFTMESPIGCDEQFKMSNSLQ